MTPFERPSDAYSDALRTGSDGVCSHSPLYPLVVRRGSNPSLGLGAPLRLPAAPAEDGQSVTIPLCSRSRR
jgi:hypothetical protein